MSKQAASYQEFVRASAVVARQFLAMRESIGKAVEEGSMTKRQGEAAVTVMEACLDIMVVIRDELWNKAHDDPPDAPVRIEPDPDAPAPAGAHAVDAPV